MVDVGESHVGADNTVDTAVDITVDNFVEYAATGSPVDAPTAEGNGSLVLARAGGAECFT